MTSTGRPAKEQDSMRAVRGAGAALAVVAAAAFAAIGSPVGAAIAAPTTGHGPHVRIITVSPHGSGHAVGSSRHPLRSLQAAQRRARAAVAAGDRVTVQLRGGTYALTEPLDFGPGDSGRKG